MSWIDFPLYYQVIIGCWLFGAIGSLPSFKNSFFSKVAMYFLLFGWLSLVLFIASLWLAIDRPPMRTLGETRLWYAVFLPLVGFVTYFRWSYRWLLWYSFLMAGLFLTINYLHPETYSKTLMPALQSPWFIPHVLVYLFSYAVLAASSIVAVKGLLFLGTGTKSQEELQLADNLVYIGLAFLSMGLLFGALWAKEAWGHYWAWDPKEVWAFLTWVAYMTYVHYRHAHRQRTKQALTVLALAFVILLICWFGVNYLPTASSSVHTYTRY